jgi:hypothetical protein
MNKKYKVISFLIIIILIIIVVNHFFGINDNGILPNFKYENINGLKVEKKHFNPSKKTLIVYFSTSCLSCKSEILNDTIFKISKSYNLILITSNKNKKEVSMYINHKLLK